MAFANFHLHSFFSDGNSSPVDLIDAVYKLNDLKYFALTDHDTLSGIEPVFKLKKKYEFKSSDSSRVFVPGIELSLAQDELDLSIHIIGLFPDITEKNYLKELDRLDSVLGEYCQYSCSQRGFVDMEARIKKAFQVNLDSIADRFEGPETVIGKANERAMRINFFRFMSAGKERDRIGYPSPVTYQVIIDIWVELIPSSSKEKIALYILRPDSARQEALTRLYVNDGMVQSKAEQLAKKNQGILSKIDHLALKRMEFREGLQLLKQARATTILAHPAVDNSRVGFEEFDRHVLIPLIDQGLDGIEVFYPYDLSYREKAFKHYGTIAQNHGMLISGGTDFHGDGRVGLDEVKLDTKEALRIIHQRKQEYLA
jgi:predicted metal-dependent phosphoesterase TrpH